jgi:parallel beta-helix repeat protein
MSRNQQAALPVLLAIASIFLLTYAALSAEAGKAMNTRTGRAYVSLATAIGEAEAGDRIEIGSGSYAGSFEIARSINLAGIDTGAGLPVVDGKGQTVVLDIKADGVRVEGLRITSSGSPTRPWGFLTPYAEEACILVEGDSVHVTGNQITGCGQGIYLRNVSGGTISGNHVDANHIGGIFLLNSRDVKVEANAVIDNGYLGVTVQSFSFPKGIEYSYRAAKLVGDWWHVTYETRDVTEILSQDNEISDNTISGHGQGGILVGFARRISALRNAVTENGGAPPSEIDIAYYGEAANPSGRGFGILLSCDAYDNKVADNQVTRNDNHGVDVSYSLRNLIRANTVEGSDFGIRLEGSFGNRIEGNTVVGNNEFGLRIETGRVLDIMTLPSIGNAIVHNDLRNPGVNAFDNSSGDNSAPGKAWLDVAALKQLPAYPTETTNAWDDGSQGNHYSDFDEMAEGFVDQDNDGVGEAAHAIAGGSAVDHFPLLAERMAGAHRVATATARQAGHELGCGTGDTTCMSDSLSSPCPAS